MVVAGQGGNVRSLFDNFGPGTPIGAGGPRIDRHFPRTGAFGQDAPAQAERPTVAGNAIGQIVANRAMFQADAVDPPTSHPDVRAARRDREYLQEMEGFVEPDNLGLIECVLCKYGVFNESTQNTAMGHFQAMFYMFCDRMNDAQMYTYMSQFWNADLRMEYPHVPPVTVSGVTHHFTRCLRRRNTVLRLGTQMDRLDRALEAVEETGLYVEPDAGGSSDDEPELPQQDRELLGTMGQRLDALRRYMELPPDVPNEEGVVARRGLSVEAENRICSLMNEMVSHVAGMTRRRRRRRRRVAVSEEGAATLQKLSTAYVQTAKIMLEWRRYEDSEESAKTGLPTYCRKRKRTNETLVDIYSNKRVRADGGPTAGAADEAARAPGDLTDRFGAY